MNTQAAWPARLTRTIAAQVKRIRTARKLSAQQLSDSCARLGLEMPRSVLADLENGRRAHISVAELLVLARALDVPPLLLVFPVGAEDQAEALPGEIRAPFRAAQWFTGERAFPGPDDSDYLREIAADWNYATGNPLAVFRDHDAAVANEVLSMRRARALEERAGRAPTAEDRADFAASADALRRESEHYRADAENLRRRAKELGLLPPTY
jgi:transcriptional regulator with XRE-family HTH domain